MMTIRALRLQYDFQTMQALKGSVIQWEQGDNRFPPEKYIVHYRLIGMASPDFYSDEHTVEIRLLPEYPSRPPLARFISRPLLFHPHVFEDGYVCIGGYSPDEGLASFCLRIAKYIQCQPKLIDPSSPANGHALDWAKRNRKILPIDNTPLPELAE